MKCRNALTEVPSRFVLEFDWRGLRLDEASSAQNNIAAVSADGSTVWVLIRRLNSSWSPGQITMRKVDGWAEPDPNSPISRLTLLPDHVSSSSTAGPRRRLRQNKVARVSF